MSERDRTGIQARTEGREREIKVFEIEGGRKGWEYKGKASETSQKYPQNGPNIELRH